MRPQPENVTELPSDGIEIAKAGIPLRYKLAVLLAVITLLVYANSLAAPFLFDDWLFIGEDGIIRLAWKWDSWRYLNRAFATWTLQLNYEWGGGFYPWKYRLANVVIHIAAGLTLFGLVRRTVLIVGVPTRSVSEESFAGAAGLCRDASLERADWLAAAVALLWLVHPLQTEAVTYVVQRYESLMGLFFLLTMYLAVRGSQSQQPRDWYIAAVVAATIGAACKEVIAVVPLVMALYDRAFLASTWREVWRKRWPLYVGLLLPVTFVLYSTRNLLIGDEVTAAGFAMKDVTAWEYLRSQPGVILHYLRLVFWPDRLILDYGWPVADSPLAIYGLGAIIVALVVASLWSMWRHPRIGFLAMAFFLILAPTSSIMPIKDLAFEHRMYLPLAAIAVMAVLAAEWLLRRLPLAVGGRGQVALVLVAVVAGSLGLRTVLRNRDYADDTAIWKQCIENNPLHPRPYRILADVFQKADPHLAIDFYHEALAKNPKVYWLWVDLGNAQLKRGRIEEAIAAYEKAVALEPSVATAHLNLSRLRMRTGDFAGAIASVRKAAEVQPNDAVAQKQLAWLLATADDESVRDGEQAISILQKLPQDPKRIDIQYLEVLSAAHAEAGQFDEAIAAAEQALAEARKIHSRRVAEFEARVQLYQSHRPFRTRANVTVGMTAQVKM
jgi:tetratricopeptide (TPR) repeat protein